MMTDAQYVKHCCKVFKLDCIKWHDKGDGYAAYDWSSGKGVIVAEGKTYKELRDSLNKWAMERAK